LTFSPKGFSSDQVGATRLRYNFLQLAASFNAAAPQAGEWQPAQRSMKDELRQLVRTRARGTCEYCRVPLTSIRSKGALPLSRLLFRVTWDFREAVAQLVEQRTFNPPRLHENTGFYAVFDDFGFHRFHAFRPFFMDSVPDSVPDRGVFRARLRRTICVGPRASHDLVREGQVRLRRRKSILRVSLRSRDRLVLPGPSSASASPWAS